MALTVAQAFTVAFELWQEAKEGRTPWPRCCLPLSAADAANLPFGSLTRVLRLWAPVCVLPEKGKRVKSGSAGEASSSSHSERSNSLGSLKGTGGANSMFWCFILIHGPKTTSSRDHFPVMNLKGVIFSLRSSSHLSDATTDNLLDLEDAGTAATEANGNVPEDRLDNRRRESNNNPAWVSLRHPAPTGVSV